MFSPWRCCIPFAISTHRASTDCSETTLPFKSQQAKKVRQQASQEKSTPASQRNNNKPAGCLLSSASSLSSEPPSTYSVTSRGGFTDTPSKATQLGCGRNRLR